MIRGIRAGAVEAGFELVRHCVRTVHFAQASYHRSADGAIRTPRDHVLFFDNHLLQPIKTWFALPPRSPELNGARMIVLDKLLVFGS